jgi:hypothetical protein
LQIRKEASGSRSEHRYDRKSRRSIAYAAIPGGWGQYWITSAPRSEITQSIRVIRSLAESGYHRGRGRRHGRWRGINDAVTDKLEEDGRFAAPYAEPTGIVASSRVSGQRAAAIDHGRKSGEHEDLKFVTEAQVESAI